MESSIVTHSTVIPTAAHLTAANLSSSSIPSCSQPPVATISEAISETAPSSKQLSLGQEFRIFLSTFITIFLAELGDKTQLTTLLMSAESHSPWIVFLGAGSALIATSLLGVWVGCWLSKRVSARTLETAAAALLLLISVLLLWDVAQG